MEEGDMPCLPGGYSVNLNFGKIKGNLKDVIELDDDDLEIGEEEENQEDNNLFTDSKIPLEFICS
jgi:hypothetical protein